MNEIELVEQATAGARNYASRWRVEPWHAYVWMLEELLAGRKKFARFDSNPAVSPTRADRPDVGLLETVRNSARSDFTVSHSDSETALFFGAGEGI